MNYWTQLSIEFANQRNYLDELYKVYPISPNLRREISAESSQAIESHFLHKNNVELVKELLKLDLFPLKDSYVASNNSYSYPPNTFLQLYNMF